MPVTNTKRVATKINIEANINYSKKTTKESDYSESNKYYEQLKEQLLSNNSNQNYTSLIENINEQAESKFKQDQQAIIKNDNPLNKSNNSIKSLFNFNLNDEDYRKKIENEEKGFDNILKNQFKNEYHEIYDFMDKIGLSQFSDKFIKAGYNSIEKILGKKKIKKFIFRN